MAEEGLEMRVNVYLLILRVLIVMQACTIANVGVLELELYNVDALCR